MIRNLALRMYQSLTENADGVQITVCRKETEALAALDLLFSITHEVLCNRGNFLPPALGADRIWLALSA